MACTQMEVGCQPGGQGRVSTHTEPYALQHFHWPHEVCQMKGVKLVNDCVLPRLMKGIPVAMLFRRPLL